MNTLINTNTALKIFEGHDVTAVTTVGHPVVHCYRTWYEIAPTVGVDIILINGVSVRRSHVEPVKQALYFLLPI